MSDAARRILRGLMVAAAFQVVPAFAAPPAPIKMYRDESRCMQLGIPVWVHVRLSEGLFQTRVMDLIEIERLSKYDVIVIQNQVETIAYSPDEIEAVRDFVAKGGGLLLVGNPAPHIRHRARFAAGRLTESPRPLPVEQFSSNRLAALFDIAFTNAVRPGIPAFAPCDMLGHGLDTDKLTFKQPLGRLLCKTRVVPLVLADGQPVVVAAEYQKGRIIICGASRLLAKYGTLPERKLGHTEPVIDAQRALLLNWLEWLAANSPVRTRSHETYPRSIPGRVHLMGDQIEVFTIPPLQDKAVQLLADWAKVWPDMAGYVGVHSPVELASDEPGAKLQIYLRASPAGGLSGGTGISIPAMGTDERLIAILGHEVGHKLLGGCNTSVSEAFAEWLGARALAAVGQEAAAKAKLAGHLANFHTVDVTGRNLDIADPLTDIRQSPACQGKWIWILEELSREHGDDLIARYLEALRADLQLVKPARKLVRGREQQLTMADHVEALSRAAGRDLASWFKELGITVDARPDRGRYP